MKSYEPHQLPAHRTFFTHFDGGPLVGVPPEAAELSMLRKLKLLLLTKSHVVVAASQLLESETAHRILLEYPELVTSGAIVSSMKVRHPTTTQFLEEKRDSEGQKRPGFLSPRAADLAGLIDEQGSAVRWSLSSMSDWFRDRLVADLGDDGGLLHAAARRQEIVIPEWVATRFSGAEGLSRETVQAATGQIGDADTARLINSYADFLYYLSGARTTDSMGLLPQENYLDFKFSELLGRPSGMSEDEIFFKIFVDIVKTKTEKVFPAEFLDVITVPQALELREIGLQRGFIDGYNSIQTKTKDAVNVRDQERLILVMSELDELESRIHTEFSAALDSELDSASREARQRAAGRTLKTLTSMVYPRLFEPGAYKELAAATLEWGGRKDLADAMDRKVQTGYSTLERLLEASSLLERQPLLDFVDEMKRRYMAHLL